MMLNSRTATMVCAIAVAALGVAPSAAFAQTTATAGVPAVTAVLKSKYPFDVLVARLEKSIDANKMGLVARASASRGASARGVKIPGNAVLMVFRNDYAVRMLAASVPAGIEAPIRIYVTEDPDGTASVSYRTPSTIFAPYRIPELNALAKELDPIFERIVRDAVSAR